MKVKLPVEPSEVTFSPDGRFIAAIYALGPIKIYASKERLVRQINLAKMLRGNYYSIFETAAFSKDGQRFACAFLEESTPTQLRIYIWRTKDWKVERTVSLSPALSVSVPFYPSYLDPSSLHFDASLFVSPHPDPSGWDYFVWRMNIWMERLLSQS